MLHDHFNAEIVVKTIENKQEAVDYLTWTFYYHRLLQNPHYYNLTGTTHRHVSDHLSELVETTLADLDKAGMISIEDDRDLTALNPSLIAAYYYIRYTTIEMFASALQQSFRTRQIVDVLSRATEFEELPMRRKEDKLLKPLLHHAKFKIDNASLQDPATKAHLLLQAHFSRTPLPADLVTDQRAVVETSARLLQAMHDIISSSNWLKAALACMEVSQMVVQALWLRDPPLLQLPHVTAKEVHAFSEHVRGAVSPTY